MTIVVISQELQKVLLLYQDQLSKLFLYKPLTPATLQRMKDELERIRLSHKKMEKNHVWDVKVEIVPTGVSSFTLQPILDDVTLVERPEAKTVYR
jgi:hypothetical protein